MNLLERLNHTKRVIRIAYLIGCLKKGGQERQLIYLLQSMEPDEFRVQLHIWDYSPNDFFLSFIPEHVQIKAYRPGFYRPLKLMFFLWHLFWFKPNIVHSYAFYLNRLASISKKLFWWRIKAIGALRSSFRFLTETRSQKLLEDSFLPMDIVQVNSLKSKTELESFAKKRNRNLRIDLIPNALDTNKFSCDCTNHGEEFKSVSVGRMISTKEFPAQILIVKGLVAKGIKLKHTIVGYGPEKCAILEMIEKEGMRDVIRVIEVDDPVNEYCEADIFIQTSSTEGLPNCILEAMSCGLCCFATDVGDTSRLITDRVTGFLVNKGDFAKLENILENEIRKNGKGLIHKIGKEASARVREAFSLESNYKMIKRLYEPI